MTAVETIQPGIYDLTAEEYHRDPVPGGSLSSSSARLLLPPSCPALYRYVRDNPPPTKRHYDLGHAAHKLVLGVGSELVEIPFDNYLTKAAKAKQAEAHAADKVPVLTAELEQVHAMAQAIRAHPIAAALFEPDSGAAELSLIWPDPATGIWLRARPDWLPTAHMGRFIVPEYKTTRSAQPDALMRMIPEHGYHIQGAWYLAGIRALGLAADPALVFIFQEKTPPYLITPVQLTQSSMELGDALGREAIGIYQRCVAADEWPGYTDGIELIPLPPWMNR